MQMNSNNFETIRMENLLGTPKCIVGNKSADLVLETLGKIYIKTGRKLQLLDDIFKNVDFIKEEDLSSKTIIVKNQQELKDLKYPGDGYFIFSIEDSILYLSLDKKYIALIKAEPIVDEGYVKRSGDIMTGSLEIRTKGAPLIVYSKDLVKNLNANYLEGESASSFAHKKKNEVISGDWDFLGDNVSRGFWDFKKVVHHRDDVTFEKSIGSPNFASGYSGYGWRLDSRTNTLTVDNLIVRKIMMVFEFIINQIKATNGSLWVSNSAKIDSVYKVEYNNVDKYYIGSTISEGEYLYITSLMHNPPLSDPLLINMTEILGASFEEFVVEEGIEIVKEVKTYFKYFASTDAGNYFIINTDSKEYSLFESGDIIRCQKYDDGTIKYYDALIIAKIEDNTFLIQVAPNFLDNYTELEYNEGSIKVSEYENDNLYNKLGKDNSSKLGEPAAKDEVVQIGNIYNSERQGNIYLTSTDNQGPYIDILDGVNRPDFSVLRKTKYRELPYQYKTVIDGKEVIYYLYDPEVINDAITLYYTPYNVEVYDTPINGFVSGSFYISTEYKKSSAKTAKVWHYTKPTKVRLGKLDGIYDPVFDVQPNGYGLYASNVFLTGEFYLNNGKSVAQFTTEEITLAVGNFEDNLYKSGLNITDKGVILWGDKVSIATTEEEFKGEADPTALFEDGKIKANLIEVETLNAKSEDFNSTITLTKCLVIQGKTYELVGLSKAYIQQKEEISSGLNEIDYYTNTEKLIVRGTARLIVKNINTETYYSTNGTILGFKVSDKGAELPPFINSLFYENTELQLTQRNVNNTYTSLSINILGKGEIITYWPSGFVMNCKLYKLEDNNITGCVEYFFSDGICTKEDINLGYSVVDTLSYEKKIDYFRTIAEINVATKTYYVSNLVREVLNGLTWDNIPSGFNNTNTFPLSDLYSAVVNDPTIGYYNEVSSVDNSNSNIKVYENSQITEIDTTEYLYKPDSSLHTTLVNYIESSATVDASTFAQLLLGGGDNIILTYFYTNTTVGEATNIVMTFIRLEEKFGIIGKILETKTLRWNKTLE